MKKLFALGYLTVTFGTFGLILTVLLVHVGIIKQESNIAFEIIAMFILMYAPLLAIDIFMKDKAVNAFAYESKKAVKAAKEKYRRMFPPFPRHLVERGAIGRDLRAAQPLIRRGTGRQHGCNSTATRQAANGKSSDDDGGDGEPPRLPALFPLLPLLFTYIQFSLLIGCSVKTLRNKVSCGLFPRPVQTIFGPRFNQEHLALVLTPPTAPASAGDEKRGPGRPRIYQDKGGAA